MASVSKQMGRPEEQLGGKGIPGRDGVVHEVSGADDQPSLVWRSVEEKPRLVIPKELDDLVRDPPDLPEPARIERRLVGREQRVSHGTIVLEKGVHSGRAVLVGAEKPTLSSHTAEDEVEAVDGCSAVALVTEHASGFGESPRSHSVPTRQDLFVSKRWLAQVPGLQESPTCFTQPCTEVLWLQALTSRCRSQVMGEVEDAAPLEVTTLAHAVASLEQLSRLPVQNRPDLGNRPDVKHALLSLGVGVQSRVESSLRRAHVGEKVLERSFRDVSEVLIAGRLEGLQVQARQERVVVQHLLEVGHQPMSVYGIPMKAAAQVIVYSAPSHGMERLRHHVQRRSVAGAGVHSE